ncbi:Isomerizing glutamine--fructose-6-phosphate aminotransferase [Candidatus Kinetoplastibacterium sorsogonicusi]|uniref:Glutamine--fructose-6-phosphate aminotransferase [isomerizing] n=1 Tax=Candidatus Kinetoplastidibacterium kentomonadis TaxID=1576550 RepID=A0A3S7J940_9PROT|nr:glutamine--fructose-6-phosphate transaminase (isomerizing) [Candidatus Kinetoplastibacterium sorsogonicusi]AWD32183.1 Isomerizing glutamine--fructose-6-phosphate aminotransferase [Candidatus Kinetoplastibacterium sorsogonicusi]
MCGIIGAISKNDVTNILLNGLSRLEYRGYDSCGIALSSSGLIKRARSMRRVTELREQVKNDNLFGSTGIAHTRWATHGIPSTNNAHPHFSDENKKNCIICVVHNGIIENYEELRNNLIDNGYLFRTQTDTEVIANLIHYFYKKNFLLAVKNAVSLLKGTYSIAVLCNNESNRIIAVKQGSPLLIGISENNKLLASDEIALLDITKKMICLEDGDLVDLGLDNISILDAKGRNVDRKEYYSTEHYINAVNLGKYTHYMQKEIFEQPRAVSDCLQDINTINSDIFYNYKKNNILDNVKNILIIACGTSYYAGLTAKYWLESIAKIHVSVEIASEYSYRDSVPNKNNLIIAISQSGETADTLHALRHAKSLGMLKTIAICNVKASSLVKECSLSYITKAGVEIGVASTKAFTTQLVSLFLLTLVLAKNNHIINKNQESIYLKYLRHLPLAINTVLCLEKQIISWANIFAVKENILFLGRGIHYPIALEGALKLKEISYIHAEAYSAGELKHGPLALITDKIPVIVIAPKDYLLEKLKSNMHEVRARGGMLYVFADSDSKIFESDGIHVIRMPEHYGVLSPILHTIPLQLLAYHTARIRGTDIDKPRNLAKSVTVE